MPQFTAINGLEAKAIILARISKALDETGDFNQNITYPWWKYSFEVRMTSYPKAAFEAELQPVVSEVVEADPEALIPAEAEAKETVVAETNTVDTPDQARVEAELPLPTATPIKNVGIVDAPVMQQAPKGKRGK